MAAAGMSIFVPPQKIVHSVELAARVTEELAKFGGANFDTVFQLSEEFLANIKVHIF